MDVHRLFVSLPIPEPVKAAIAEAQGELRAVLPKSSLHLTTPHQFHLTMRFLGDVPVDRVPDLARSLVVACKSFGPMALRAERIGVFPDLRFPRVVWVWVHDDADRLVALQRSIEVATGGEREKRDFVGHATIARLHAIKRPQADALSKLAHSMADRRFGEWTAGEICLMRSELLPGGAQHTTVSTIPLAG